MFGQWEELRIAKRHGEPSWRHACRRTELHPQHSHSTHDGHTRDVNSFVAPTFAKEDGWVDAAHDAVWSGGDAHELEEESSVPTSHMSRIIVDQRDETNSNRERRVVLS